MKKAKSRLQQSKDPTQSKYFSLASDQSLDIKPLISRSKNPQSLFIAYLKHIPTLLISLPFLYSSYYILTQVKPDKIKNFLLPNTYFPLLISVFLGSFFCLSFITLKTRRGLILSLMITCLLFLKLQNVEMSIVLAITIIGSLTLILVAWEFVLTLIHKK